MTVRYRAAVVGLGRIGCELSSPRRPAALLNHVAAYLHNSRIELVGLCDTHEDRVARCAGRYPGVSCYTSLKALLDKAHPEIVSICTPTETHWQVAKTVLLGSSVRALFVEKPIAHRLEDAADLMACAAARNVVLAINHTRRYVREFDQLARAIDQGAVGRLLCVMGQYNRGIINNGVHWFDLAEKLVGSIGSVQAMSCSDPQTSDPTPDLLIEFTHGVRGYLAGLRAAEYGTFELRVAGARGVVDIRRAGREIALWQAGPSEDAAGHLALGSPKVLTADLDQALPSAVEDLIEALDKGSVVRGCPEAALRSLAIAHAAISSIRSGLRVNV